jgi:pimeloyl-ACP methyl ester carboxylesterase
MKLTYLGMRGSSDLRLALHHVEPDRKSRQAVLCVHGSTYPTRLSAAFEFSPGDSWLHHIAGRGILACGLDFVGYGASSPTTSQREAPGDDEPPSPVQSKVEQIHSAIEFIRREWNVDIVHLVAHSYGTIPASAFAAAYPTALQSLTLFGPIVLLPSHTPEAGKGQWFRETAERRFSRLRSEGESPSGKQLLEPEVEARWSAELAASTPRICGDVFGEMRLLNGPPWDIDRAKNGIHPYSASDVLAPMFVVYGNHDDIVDDNSAKAHLARFSSSPMKWQLRIDEGTHSMQLEINRRSLYAAVDGFLWASTRTG